jgi:DNA invertase Pin-like site-specific DNA recombinase
MLRITYLTVRLRLLAEKPQREGRYKGRVPTARRQAAEIARLKADGVSPSEIATRLGIGRASVYRVMGKQAADDQVAA